MPEFGALFERLQASASGFVQEEIKVSRGGRMENLLVRMSTRRTEQGKREGYVVAFDDVTDLVAAQRMAAWGDVARRIAHEIKNPLTPIKLSAERINRKFGRVLTDEAEGQPRTADRRGDPPDRRSAPHRRRVLEIRPHARAADGRQEDLMSLIVREAVLLQEAGQPDVRFETDMPEGRGLGRSGCRR